MTNMITEILKKDILNRDDIVYLLKTEGEEKTSLLKYAAKIKGENVGNKVYLRGLIEFSNVCEKNCLYCGIRKDNKNVIRYNLSDDEILEAARFAYENDYGSVVLQSGEIQNISFTNRIEKLLKEIKKLSDNHLGITLSCGEQEETVYREWFNAGAHRYLLRIETANQELYEKIHPHDSYHSWEKRVKCLYMLKDCGYQVGTGVMVGLPFQSIEHLAEDLLFMRELDIDMCGMGPYIEHKETPLFAHKNLLIPPSERFDLTMKMVAILRILMPDINIAATTALQAIDKIGREKIIKVGANVLMPNITPAKYRNYYSLYQNKPCADENAEDCVNCIEVRIKIAGAEIGYGKWGDSLHYRMKKRP